MGPRDGAGEMVRAWGVRVTPFARRLAARTPHPSPSAIPSPARGEGARDDKSMRRTNDGSSSSHFASRPNLVLARCVFSRRKLKEALASSSRSAAAIDEICAVRRRSDLTIADFVCFEYRLIVECDGSQHADSAYDDMRDAILIAQGFAFCGFGISTFWVNRDIVLKRLSPQCGRSAEAPIRQRLQSGRRREGRRCPSSVALRATPSSRKRGEGR